MRKALVLITLFAVSVWFISCASVPTNSKLLLDASRRGDIQTVKSLIAKGADVNHKKRSHVGETALHVASENGHTDIVKALLANGANVNQQTNGGWTALAKASENGHTDIVKVLLSNGADVNVIGIGDTGLPALFLASMEGHYDIVKALLEKGADVNAKVRQINISGGGSSTVTALDIATKKGHEGIVQLLKKAGAKEYEARSVPGTGATISPATLQRGIQRMESLLSPFQSALKGRNEVRVKNPNDFSVVAGVRKGNAGMNLHVPANGTASVFLPDGKYNIFFVYSNKPDALFQGDSFTLNHNGVEIQIVKAVGGNYGIRRVR